MRSIPIIVIIVLTVISVYYTIRNEQLEVERRELVKELREVDSVFSLIRQNVDEIKTIVDSMEVEQVEDSIRVSRVNIKKM